jgi:hypothetical protein
MPQSAAPEGMVKLAHTLVETPHLRSWFFSMEALSDALRKAAFIEMASRMRQAKDDAEITDAVEALARPKMYETILLIVRERPMKTPVVPDQTMESLGQ